ncbi:hypothetical protein BU14_0023s0034 [Porphyra umbilicalis]|uniref:Uncharacterized protein n=1 Tax=Porphyra umbilicalis TaxID=2786 RepID=A0A1X6PK30_PORUM|nr:hypothetical protein BU14_0023s0034 [Porphyra umbilicalis]|eukprot:OSX81229.1 hypothetical protein BU14_0023s0034 [Porphyra umbilicalis]
MDKPRVHSDGRWPNAGAAGAIDAVTACYASVSLARDRRGHRRKQFIASLYRLPLHRRRGSGHTPPVGKLSFSFRPPCYARETFGHSGYSPGHQRGRSNR